MTTYKYYVCPEFHVKIKLPSFSSNWRRILGKYSILYHFLELNNKNNHSDIKISIGIATCDKQGSLANTVKQADVQMYLDKR